MKAPEFMPVLSAGAHSSPENGACVMEYVSVLAGERFSDSPVCTNARLAFFARKVNDYLPDTLRHLMVPLIPKLIGTGRTENLPPLDRHLLQRLDNRTMYLETTIEPFRNHWSNAMIYDNGGVTYLLADCDAVKNEIDCRRMVKAFEMLIDTFRDVHNIGEPNDLTTEQQNLLLETVKQ